MKTEKQNDQRTELQKENANELQKLQNDYQTLRNIITPQGFYQTWLYSAKNFKNRKDAFNSLNQEYFNLVGVFKYDSYNAFLRVNNI